MSPATTDPAVPRAGMLATVRNRRGVVAAVEPFDGETGRLHLVHLEYTDDRSPDDGRVKAMGHSELLKRITVRPDVFGGKPIVRDMRLSVELILSLLAQGATPEEILDDYPRLEADDIRACIAYAHAAIADDTLAAVSVTRR